MIISTTNSYRTQFLWQPLRISKHCPFQRVGTTRNLSLDTVKELIKSEIWIDLFINIDKIINIIAKISKMPFQRTTCWLMELSIVETKRKLNDMK